MKELSYDLLEIELTRKCNMSCEHCLRGEAQDVTLSRECIDSFMQQTRQINQLSFTGGEPSLCVDTMRYFLDKMKERNVFLGDFSIILNGKLQSPELVEVLKDYSRYIGQWQQEYDPCLYMKVGISQDQYHTGVDSLDSYYYYKVNLHGYGAVSLARNGIAPTKIGRAVKLKESIKGIDSYCDTHQKIEILEKGKTVVCPNAARYKLYYDEQIFIPCEIYITAHGDVINRKLASIYGDYKRIDANYFCSVKDDIYEEILKYNEGKPSCNLCLFKEHNLMKRDTLENALDIVLFGSEEMRKNMNQKHAEMQVYSPVYADIRDKMERTITFEGENELIDKLQKELDEKERLFDEVMSGNTDIKTTYTKEFAYMVKHMTLKQMKEK